MSSSINSLAEKIRSCRLCPLAEGRKIAVPGEGPPHSEIMMVGEAPGKDEDESGRPFIGRAGRLLDSALQSARIRREDVFVTNVVKCRPPKNRVPRKIEIESCTNAYLHQQVETIKPKTIILLGRTATMTMLNEKTLKRVRGKTIALGQINYLPTYHPAAVLRNPNLKPTLISDLKKVQKIGGHRK
jgi:uracil-DNA glycosylase